MAKHQLALMRRSSWLLAALALSTALLVVTASGDAGVGSAASRWSEPETVLPEQRAAVGAQLGAGPRRLAVALWTRGVPSEGPEGPVATGTSGRSVQVAVRGRGNHTFGSPQTLQRGAEGGQLAVSRRGEALAGWRQDARLEAALRPPNGEFADEEVVSPTGATGFDLALGSDGTGVVAWERAVGGEDRIEVAVRRPGGTFGSPDLLSEAGTAPRVAVNSAGAAVVVWERPGARDQPARASFRPADGAFGPAEPIPNSEHSNAGLEVAIDDRGTVIVLVNGEEFRQIVKSSVRTPGGSFSPARQITEPGRKANFAELGIDRDGRAIAIWNRFDGGGPAGVEASSRPAGGEWREPRLISGGKAGGELALSVNHGGEAIATFSGLGERYRVLAAYFSPGSGWGDPERVSPPLGRRAVPSSANAIGPSGEATAIWGRPRPEADFGVFASNRPR